MNESQELKVLEVLKSADGNWVNGRHFCREMGLTQYHRALWNLMHKKHRYEYKGEIQPSDFKDEYGFKSYRLKASESLF